MIVRAAVAGDVPAMAEIAAESYAQAFAAILDPEALAARNAAFFATAFAAKLALMRVAEIEGRVVALAMTTGEHLDMLFVAPDAQGHGAGSALLANVESMGVRTLECFRDNHEARRFYERHGWRLIRSYEREFIGRARAFVFYEKRATASA